MRRRTRRRGAALVAAIIAVSTLTVLGVALLQVTTSASAVVRTHEDDLRARFLAEAGIHEAIDALRAGGTGRVGDMALPATLGDGLFWVQATDLPDNQVQLRSTALVGEGRAAVGVVVRRPVAEAPLFPSLLNSDEELTMSSDVVTDSFDSSLGSYPSQQVNFANGHAYAKDGGHVRSNANVVLNARATVFGDATPGPGNSVTYGTDALVTGSDAPAAEPFNFPAIDPPAIPLGAPFVVPLGGSATLASGDHGFTRLAIEKDATLRIEGPATILLDEFSGGKDATLEIDARAGPITIYTTTYLREGGFMTNRIPGSPLAVAFMISGVNDIEFASMSRIRGAYYAPKATVTFGADNMVWGAFAAKRITMTSDMRFHFDEHLQEHWTSDTNQGAGADPEILAWFETSVQPDAIRVNRGDPYEVLGVAQGSALNPGAAREFDE